jgi:hypothetical protein
MGKVVFWITVVFIVLLVLRIVNINKARARRAAQAASAGQPASQPMIRCADCAVFVPRDEARLVAGVHRCADPNCANRRSTVRQ